MKNQAYFLKPLLAFAVVLILAVGCKQDVISVGVEDEAQENTTVIDQSVIDKLSAEEGALEGLYSNSISTRSAITYSGELCEDVISATHSTLNSYNQSEFWDYYSFEGTAGDVVSISVDRTSPGFDAGSSLFFGTTNDNSGVSWYNGGANMTHLVGRDDDQCNIGCDCWEDPLISGYSLPSTGTYTFAVFDVLGCGQPFNYTITTSGISCEMDSDGDGVNDDVDNCPNTANADQADNDGDGAGDACDPDDDNDGVLDVDDNCQFTANSDQANYDGDAEGDTCDDDDDNDGCNDDVDAHPYSNQDATINIDGCDSGVDNVFIGCSTMMDLIADCAATADNHADFVSCVAALTNDWKSAGLISGKDKGKIQSCAAQSNIP